MESVWLVFIFLATSVFGEIELSGFTVIQNHVFSGSIYKDSQQLSLLQCAAESATFGTMYPVLEYYKDTLTCRLFQHQNWQYIQLTPTTLMTYVAVLNGLTAVTKELRVTNGMEFGDWSDIEFCSPGSFAVGYAMQIEEDQGIFADDSALNSVSLYCSDRDTGIIDNNITAAKGFWGTWEEPTYCPPSPERMFLKAFSLEVEPYQGDGDDSAANFVKFNCRDIQDQLPSEEISLSPGHGLFGTWGEWSSACDPGSAICGLMTRIEPKNQDNSALNDVVFFCCIN